MSKISQIEMIKAHLLSGHTITPIEALNKFGCLSLAQRISNLKQLGLKISSTTKKVGNNKRVAEYQLTEMP